mgnify:CR=1 FL=1
MVARGKGVITGSLTLKHMYKAYKKSCKEKEIDYVAYKLYATACKDFNKRLVNAVVEQSEEVTLPHRLGNLKIRKRERNLSHMKKNKWPVDYERSKELGFIVYHDSDYTLGWRWDKRKCVVKWKGAYHFRACRAAKRLVPEAVKFRKRDYFN